MPGGGEDLVQLGRRAERVLGQFGDVRGHGERHERAVGDLDAAGALEVAFEDEYRFVGGQIFGAVLVALRRARELQVFQALIAGMFGFYLASSGLAPSIAAGVQAVFGWVSTWHI